MKFKFSLGAIGGLVLFFVAFQPFKTSRNFAEDPHTATDVNPQNSRKIASINQNSSITSAKSVSDTEKYFYKSYFKDTLLKSKGIAEIYKTVSKKLAATPTNDLIAMYIAEGIGRNNSGGFSQFMMSLQSALSENSESVYNSILDEESTLKQDPFVYQMILNLASTLPLPNDQKANLLGQALVNGVTFDQNGELTRSANNVTNALIVMKKSGISESQIAQFVQQGYNSVASNPKAQSAFSTRVSTYYPSLKQ